MKLTTPDNLLFWGSIIAAVMLLVGGLMVKFTKKKWWGATGYALVCLAIINWAVIAIGLCNFSAVVAAQETVLVIPTADGTAVQRIILPTDGRVWNRERYAVLPSVYEIWIPPFSVVDPAGNRHRLSFALGVEIVDHVAYMKMAGIPPALKDRAESLRENKRLLYGIVMWTLGQAAQASTATFSSSSHPYDDAAMKALEVFLLERANQDLASHSVKIKHLN